MNPVVSFFRLNGTERLMAVEAAVCLLLARVLVHRVPMRYWRGWFAGAASDSAAVDRIALGRRVGGIVRAVARRLPMDAVCLPQAMAAHRILRRRGVSARLVFGARSAAFRARPDYHAWLTVDGETVIGGRIAGAFRPLATLGPQPESDAAARRVRGGHLYASR